MMSSKITGLQRILYFKYGSLGLVNDFTLGVEVFTKGSITDTFREQVEERGLGVLIQVAQIVEELQNTSEAEFEGNRLSLTRAYLNFLHHRDRPPTQKELLRYEWDRRVLTSAAAKSLPVDVDMGRSKLEGYYSGREARPGGFPVPLDRRNGRTLISELGFTLLDGQLLPTYRAIFKQVSSEGEVDLESFLRAAMNDSRVKNRLSKLLPLLDLPLPRLIDVLASPFEIHPFMRWAHSHEALSAILHRYLVDRDDLNQVAKGEVNELHELMFQLGVKLELLHQGTDGVHCTTSLRRLSAEVFGVLENEIFSNFLNIPKKDLEALHSEFSKIAEAQGALPAFDTFWLTSPIARGIVAKSPDISASKIALLEAFARAYQHASVGVSSPRVRKIADEFIPIGILAECFEKSHRIREPIIFWDVLKKDQDFLKNGG